MANTEVPLLSRLARLDRSVVAIIAAAAAIVLFLSINLIASLALQTARVDVTHERIFTVSPVTREILAQLNEPITIRLYRSQALLDAVPRLKIYADRVDEILRAYQDLSRQVLKVERIHAQPFSPEEDAALRHGLRGIPLDRGGERGYFGLVATNSVDDLEKVEFLAPEREQFLEFDLTRLVTRLAAPDIPTVAVFDGLGMFGVREQGRPPWQILELMNKSFRLRSLDDDTQAVPKEAAALLVVHPFRLTPRALYAIDQFVLTGKPAFVFVDPLAENSPPNPQNPNQPMFPDSDLEPLTTAWGVEMTPEKVVTDRSMAMRITGVAGTQRVVADYIPWLQIRPEQLDQDDPVSSQISLVRMSSAGSLRHIAGSSTGFRPMIQTTLNSMLFDEADIRRRPNPYDLLEKFKPENRRHVLMARITGPVRSAFAEGPPEVPPDAPQRPRGEVIEPHRAQSERPINVVIAADVDMLANSHVADERGRQFSNNADFIINVLENLIGGNALIGLRGRGLSARPFTTVDRIEARAEANYRATEQRLTRELEEIQTKLSELQLPGQQALGDVVALTQEQQEAIARFNRRSIELRAQLRDVRAALREEIDALETRLKLINILVVPGAVVLIGLVIAFWQRQRIARHLAARRVRAAARPA